MVDIRGANSTEKARLDVSAIGFWSPMERSLLAVRIVHPNSPSYKDRRPEQVLYIQQERKQEEDVHPERVTS